MPMYEYKCQKCGGVFETIQRFSDEPLTTHEACGGSVERLISAPAFHLKGSGWYVTDYAKTNGKSAPSETGSKAEAKSENKSSEGKSSESKSSDTASSSTAAPSSSSSSTSTSSSSSSSEKS